MKLIYTTTAIAAFSAGAVSAQQLTYGDFSADYTYTYDGVRDQDVWTLQGAIEYTINDVVLSGQLYGRNRKANGYDLDLVRHAFGAGYMFTPNILAGGGLKGYSYDANSIFDVMGVEVYGQYQDPTFGVALNHLQQDLDRDATTTTLYGVLNPAPTVELGARLRSHANSSFSFYDDRTYYYLSAAHDNGPFAIRGSLSGNNVADGGLFGTHGTAQITPDIHVLAGYATFFGDNYMDLETVNVGAGFQVAPDVWVDASYGFVTGDSFDTDVEIFSLNVNYEFGNRARIDDTFEKNVIDDENAGFGKLFFLNILP